MISEFITDRQGEHDMARTASEVKKRRPSRRRPGKSSLEVKRRRRMAAERQRTRRQEKKKRLTIRKQDSQRSVVYHLYRTMIHFFPNLFEHMREIEDYRNKSEYSLTEIITASIAMFIFTAGSRNEWNNIRNDCNFKKNYKKLFGLDLPHPDTVDNVMRMIPEEVLKKLKHRMVQSLIEKKSLHKYRFQDKYFVIAVDGTGIVKFDKQHCSQCLYQTSKKGKKTWFHNVLEAKLITPNGFSISIATEWIENPANEEYEKQDCERKAFKRLAENLKNRFPRLPVCITADGLYPYQGFFDICRDYGWKYIVTFKDGSLKTIQEEVRELLPVMQENHRTETLFEGTKCIEGQYSWVTGMNYHGNYLNWVECIETVSEEDKKPEIKKFVHLTDIEPVYQTVVYVSKTGRLRWKIENEGFNIQKNNGYKLKHKYSRVSYPAMKNYYQCLQIGHFINQLLIYSTAFQEDLKAEGKMTVVHMWVRLIGIMTWNDIDTAKLACIKHEKVQIRFAT